MKILFYCHGAGNGGAERVITTLSGAFANHSYDTLLVTSKKTQNDYVLNEKVKHIVILTDGKTVIHRTFSRILKLRKIINAFNPDCIISFSTVPNLQILFASLFTKRHIIISERTDPARYPDSVIGKILRSIMYPMADTIVFQTAEARNYFRKGIRKKGVIIFNPVRDDLPNIYVGERKKEIIGIGSLGEQKNWIISLKAAELFFLKHSEYVMLIYGEGSYKGKLQQYIDEHSILKNRVYLKGFSSNAVNDMNSARMYISSSNYEGISNAMLEALATGVPTICTDCPVGGPRTFIKNGENGLLIPMNDPEALCDAMEKIADNDDLCKQLSNNSIKIKMKLNLDTIFSEWEKVVLKVNG